MEQENGRAGSQSMGNKCQKRGSRILPNKMPQMKGLFISIYIVEISAVMKF